VTEKKEPVVRYVAAIGIDLPTGRYEVGDEIPKRELKKHWWLVDRGKVRAEE
jgi:hypothetical protein